MILPADTVSLLLATWLWPFLRVAALLTSAPLLGASYVNRRVRLALAFALGLVLTPLVEAPAVSPLSAGGLLLGVEQVVVGLLMGFAARLMLLVFDLAGQLVSQTMGLGFAAMVDPASGAQVPAVSQLYLILTSLVFVTLDGHLLLVQVLARSFEVLPLGASVDPGAFRELAMRTGWVLGAGAVIALPSVTAMLLVNLAFGVMTRTAPQLNLFAVGFPITLIMGFVVILLSLPGVLSQVETTTTEVLSWALELVGGGG